MWCVAIGTGAEIERWAGVHLFPNLSCSTKTAAIALWEKDIGETAGFSGQLFYKGEIEGRF